MLHNKEDTANIVIGFCPCSSNSGMDNVSALYDSTKLVKK